MAVLPAVMIMTGCSKGGPGKDISSSAFDSAPADIKQPWSEAIAAWKSRRYPEAAKSFVSLQAKAATLSKEQSEELTKAVDQFGQEAFTAANKGDSAATQAVQIMRGTGRRGGNPQ